MKDQMDPKELMRKQVILDLIQQMKEQLLPQGKGMLEVQVEAHPVTSSDESMESPLMEGMEHSEMECEEMPMEMNKEQVMAKLKERQKMKGDQ